MPDTPRTLYLAAQQGGTNSEWYSHVFETEKEAEKAIAEWRKDSYDGIGPIAFEIAPATDELLKINSDWGNLLQAMDELLAEAFQLQGRALLG